MRKPVIGVAGQVEVEQSAYSLKRRYVEALVAAGALVAIYPPQGDDPAQIAQILDGVDGLLMPGGDDVDPALYGQRLRTGRVPAYERDSFEAPLVRAALERQIPFLGICRGVQVLNVAFGGTLSQEVGEDGFTCEHWQDEPFDAPTHEVEVYPGTLLADVLGAGPLMVNSIHRQGVLEVAPGLEVQARAEDGLVEALALPGERFALAVQWHPEFMPDDAASVALFEAFVSRCRAYAALSGRLG